MWEVFKEIDIDGQRTSKIFLMTKKHRDYAVNLSDFWLDNLGKYFLIK